MSWSGRENGVSMYNSPETAVSLFLEKWNICNPEKIVVAVSGGADSVCLLTSLHRVVSHLSTRLECVHINHNLRSQKEAEDDWHLVAGLCSTLGVPSFRYDVPKGKIYEQAKKTGGIEAAAREVRYDLLKNHLQRNGYIALGHNKDDQMESMVMRFFQGGGTQGLRGIQEYNLPVIRPLLHVSRDSIMEYLQLNGLKWREDPSNAEGLFLRNRIRNELIPVIQSLFPGYEKALTHLKDKLLLKEQHENAEIRASVAELNPLYSREAGVSFKSAKFLSFSPFIRINILYHLYNEMGGSGRIPFSFLKNICSRDGLENTAFYWQDWGLISRKDRSFWGPTLVADEKKGYLMEVTKPGSYEICGITVHVSKNTLRASGGEEDDTDWIRSNSVYPPLILRSAEPGDIIPQKIGTKALKKIFQEMKVRETVRNLCPVLEDRKGILVVFGAPFGYKNVYAPRARSGEGIVNDSTASPGHTPEDKIIFAF